MRTYPARFVGEFDFEVDQERPKGAVGDFSVVNVRLKDEGHGYPTRYFRLVCPCGRDHFLPLNGSGVTWDLVATSPPHIGGSILSYCTHVCTHAGAIENKSTHCHVLLEGGAIKVLDDTLAPLI